MTSEEKVLLEGIHYRTGQPVRAGIRGGSLYSVTGIPEVSRSGNGERPPVIAPGLVDLQVNGFMGVDFNDGSLTADQVEEAAKAMLRHGVTRFYPTVITGPRKRTLQLIRTLAAAAGEPVPGHPPCRGNGLAAKMIGGIHLEGPFISKEDGPRGAHPGRYCTDPDPRLVEKWQKAAGGRIKLLTLAPELPGAMELIHACGEMGITVAIGHTSCSADCLEKAVEAGARLSTHLGNGAHRILPRHPNYIWDQLAEDRLFASMIGDGFHLPDSVLKVFVRAKGEKALLVSDAMPYCGLSPGEYDSPAAGRVRLTREGRLHKAGNPAILAGSAGLLIDSVHHLAGFAEFADAWDMASVRPGALMEPEANRGLKVGAPADLVLMERHTHRLLHVIKCGESYPVE